MVGERRYGSSVGTPRSFVAAIAASLLLRHATADALEVVAVSARGYVVVDEPGADPAYGGRLPTENFADTVTFVAQLTEAIARTPGARTGRFLAVMQGRRSFGSATAFYLPVRSNVRGIGNRETFDLNDSYQTAYRLDGFVWLNDVRMFLDAAAPYGKYTICTQEFGHRWGPTVRVPPRPTGLTLPGIPSIDAGSSGSDAGESDGGGADASATDARADLPPPLLPTALLGRQTAHWSWFVHSGGSPLEGNNWVERSPGVFNAIAPTFKFHPIDLYLMGVLAPEETAPLFLIAEPDLRGLREFEGGPITPATPPEPGDRAVEIRGRRVDVGVQDIIRANGPRIPRAITVPPTRYPDGGPLEDASVPRDEAGAPLVRENDFDVVWVLLTTRAELNGPLMFDFDRAVDACTDGFSFASDGRSELIALAPPRDGGRPADAAVRPPSSDGAVADGGAEDGALGSNLGGGCACRATDAHRPPPRSAALAMTAIAAIRAQRRRRRR